MQYNPYNKESSYRCDYKEISRFLDQCVAEGIDDVVRCAVYGLYGAGKSCFLNSYFTEEKCRELADKGMLFPRLQPERNISPVELFQRICLSVSEYAEKYVDAQMLPHFEDPTEDETFSEAQQRLEDMVGDLARQNYHVTLVIDEFQRLSESSTIEAPHYSKFRYLKESDKTKMGFLIANDYDFDRDNMHYTNAYSTSYLIGIFDNTEITVTGMEKAEFSEYLKGFQRSEEPPVFTPEEQALLYRLSGGIRALVKILASVMYELKSCGVTAELEKYTRIQGMQMIKTAYFDRWSSVFTEQQKALLRKTRSEGIRDFYLGDEAIALRYLRLRGIIVQNPEAPLGKRNQYCCELFADYIDQTFMHAGWTAAPAAPAESTADDTFNEEKSKLEDSLQNLLDDILDQINSCKRSGFELPDSMETYERLTRQLQTAQARLEKEICSAILLKELKEVFVQINEEFEDTRG